MSETTELIIPRPMLYMMDATHYYDRSTVGRCGGKVIDVYLYDASTHTFCCEITPSYECNYIETIPLLWPDDDDKRETLTDDLTEANRDNDFVRYFHAKDLDRIEKQTPAAPKGWTVINAPRIFQVNDPDPTDKEVWEGYLEDADGDVREAQRCFMEDTREDIQDNSRY